MRVHCLLFHLCLFNQLINPWKNLLFPITEYFGVLKSIFRVSDKVQHKPESSCTATEYGCRLEILDLESRGIALSMQ